jgi:hypothetical protein
MSISKDANHTNCFQACHFCYRPPIALELGVNESWGSQLSRPGFRFEIAGELTKLRSIKHGDF